MASSDDVARKRSQLHQELVNAYKKKIRFLLEMILLVRVLQYDHVTFGVKL